MNNNTPNALASRIGFFVAASITVISSLIIGLASEITWWIPFILFIVSYLTSYFFFLWAVSNFIDRKIRLIYKTIHNLKVGRKKGAILEDLDVDKDILTEVRKDVIEWDLRNRQEIERLTDQEKFRREFIGNVSHELKTPLFSIQGYILTLLEGGLEDPKINVSYLQRAEKSVDRMIEMVSDLDEIAKLESAQLKVNLSTIDIYSLVDEVIDALDFKAKERKIKLIIKKADDKPLWVNADPIRITQVLTNLVVNSIYYGNEGGKTEIRFFDFDENILVEVADNGRGISEEHLPRLFERFYRIEKSRSRHDGGSGLGLAIVKHIIEAHNQTINVRSSIDKGATFSFTLAKADKK
jgi:two-component system, OmpR family, phosphate regulon sensor histidine kinase PhoR